MFQNPWVNKSVMTSSDKQTSKYYKYPGVYDSIWNSLWNFFIVLPISIENLLIYCFFLFFKAKVWARKIGRATEGRAQYKLIWDKTRWPAA